MAITADEVRYRGQWESAEVSDALLNSKAFIPMGDAWLALKLSGAGLSYASLDSNEQALADAAEIAAVASVVAARAAQGEFKTGLLAIKDVNQDRLNKLAEELRDEARRYLIMIGVSEDGGFYFTSKGGGDYSPIASDETNIDFAQADSDRPFSLWP